MKVNINNASDNSKAAIPVNLLFTKARTKRNNAIRKGNIEIANSKIAKWKDSTKRLVNAF